MNEYKKTAAEERSEEEQFFPLEESAETVAPAEETQRSSEKNRKREEAFFGEVKALLEKYPHWKDKLMKGEKLPDEVIAACANEGAPLRAAMAEYELKKAKLEIERLRREIAVLRQNASAAAKAPVKGASTGGTDTKGKDPFLEGFLSED